MATNEDSPEERRRRQAENARVKRGLSPLPPPPTPWDSEEATAQVQLAAVPREQVPVPGQQQQGVKETPAPWGQQQAGGADTKAKLDKIAADVAEILATVKDMKANPPYAILG